jgi:hypothetical protein
MARPRKVTYWSSRGGYGTNINRKQHVLAVGPDDAPAGPTFKAALDKYRELLELDTVNHAGDRNSVRVLADAAEVVAERS